MAFVFRSNQKQSTPQPEPQPQPSLPSEDRPERCKTVCKGLPHLLLKQTLPMQKQNALPMMEVSPIHHGSFNFNNSVFKVKTPNNASISKDFVDTPFYTECAGTQVLSLTVSSKAERTAKSTVQHAVARKAKGEGGKVSKNLLKRMELLESKEKEAAWSKDLQINELKQYRMNDKNRLRKWQSLKKLSPLKDLSLVDQSKDSNFSCCIGKPKEDTPPTADKAPKMKFTSKRVEEHPEEGQEEEEFDSQATPGPGAYSCEPPSKKEFRSKRTQFQKIFYSQIERFRDNAKPYQEITYVNEGKEEQSLRKNSPCQSFLSKAPKFQPPHPTKAPEPGSYDTRQSLEHDLVRQILRSCNSNAFISRSPRGLKVVGEDLPGPGDYVLDRSLQKLMQERNQLDCSFKSGLEKNVGGSVEKQGRKKTQMEEQGHKVNPIHIKEDEILEDLYMSEPVPFMSTSQRFPSPKAAPASPTRKNAKLIPAVTVARQAFNSSEGRELQLRSGDGVGVGAYELGRKGLIKKSFNVFFN